MPCPTPLPKRPIDTTGKNLRRRSRWGDFKIVLGDERAISLRGAIGRLALLAGCLAIWLAVIVISNW